MSHVDELRKAINSGNTVAMLGTGFSSAVAADPAGASWIGLLEAGVEYLRENKIAADPILANISSDIELGVARGGTYLLTAGEKIADTMGRSSAVHFGKFLASTIGNLKADRGKCELGFAVQSLGVPVLTTNYDNLYEQIVGNPSCTWRDPRTFHDAITGESTEVVHLHGIWKDPDSVILTVSDYERIIRDLNTAILRQAVGVLKSIVFIGYGAGLDDPHFTQLWKWLTPMLREGVTHYLLVREMEHEKLVQAVMDKPIIAISYGSDYADLPGFIRSLAPEGNGDANSMDNARTYAKVAKTCRRRILDRLADSTLMPHIIENRDQDYDLNDLVIEPVLLPVPSEQYRSEKSRGNDALAPLSATTEILNGDAILLIGEEQSGVSTALAWATLVRAEASIPALPIILDYKEIGRQGNRRVQNAVRRYLRGAGAPLGNRDSLPSNLVIAIDNITIANETDLISTLEDLHRNLDTVMVILGCRPGAEAQIQARYSEVGGPLMLPAYLGRLGRHKTVELARRVDPDRAEPLADRVLKIVAKEGITRTPLCLILLIVGTTKDDAWISAVSHTTFVDAFIDKILGRGSVTDDMHLQIDSAGYSRVLESFAKKLIDDDSANASYVDTLSLFNEVVKNLDWTDDPADIVSSLIVKGILFNRDGKVQFRQHVYLHIFAARRCQSDPDLLARLLTRPLYYASVIRHYAALQRNDTKLLDWSVTYISDLLDRHPTEDGLFRMVTDDEITQDLPDLDDDSNGKESDGLGNGDNGSESVVVDSEGIAVDESAEGDVEVSGNDVVAPVEEPGNGASDDAGDVTYDPFDVVETTRKTPFPALDIDSAALDVKLSWQLSLVSNILRDSELVEDADLKGRGLKGVLHGWGLLMAHLYESEEIAGLVNAILDSFQEAGELSRERRDEVAEMFLKLWSIYIAVIGIGEELATVKLERAVDRIIEDQTSGGDPSFFLAAIMLKRRNGGGRLNDGIKKFLMDNRNNLAVRSYVEHILRIDYHRELPGSAVGDALEKFIVEFKVMDYADAPLGKQNSIRNQLHLSLRAGKIRARRIVELDVTSGDSVGESKSAGALGE